MEKEHIHDYRFISSELGSREISGTRDTLVEYAKVICTRCGEVKSVEVKS